MNEKECCGTCVFHKLCGGEFACGNEESGAYGLETTWDDWCGEYEEREDD